MSQREFCSSSFELDACGGGGTGRLKFDGGGGGGGAEVERRSNEERCVEGSTVLFKTFEGTGSRSEECLSQAEFARGGGATGRLPLGGGFEVLGGGGGGLLNLGRSPGLAWRRGSGRCGWR